MIRYHGSIDDFWSQDLESFKFTVISPINRQQREDWDHPNYEQTNRHLPQAFDSDLPSYWKRFLTDLNIAEGTVSWTNIEPGNVIPKHVDRFYKIRTKFGVDIDQCLRYLIFLQDWQLGHFVEFDNKIITRWKKGDVWVFDSTEYHCAANATQSNFITCQVNTFVKS